MLFFLTLLFLPTQLGKHFWPKFSFIYSLPVDYLSPTLYFWDILVVCLWVISIWQKRYVNRLALNLFLIFMLTQATSLLVPSANVGAGLVRLEQYLIAGLFGLYVASIRIVTRFVFLSLGLSILFESILAIAQFASGGTLGFWILGERSFSLSTPGIAKFDYQGFLLLRPYATFPHPNVLAAFMVISLLILWQLGSKQTWFRSATLLGGLVTLLTVSRAALVAGLISVMILAGKQARLLMVLVTGVLLPILYTRFSSLVNFDSLALIRREQLSSVALSLWSDHKVTGVGLNNFILAAQDLLLAGPSRFLQPVHNIFLLALSETGIIGLISWISLIGYPIFKKHHFMLLWAVVVFLGLFDHYFLTLPQGYRLLFLVWGLGCGHFKKDF